MDQLELFSPSRSPRGSAAGRLERAHAEAARIARQLPAGLFFGTSSWSFPGWAGIVYSRSASAAELAREGLVEYARHPLLTTVGIDRGFYAPVPERDLARYAAQLPGGFPCCAKAPQAVTAAALDGRSNPDFLSPVRFMDEMLEPFRRTFAGNCGPFVIQCPPAPSGRGPGPSEFAERLDRFLGALPSDFRYAVELRDPALLSPDYARVLADRRAAHVYNWATAMPSLADQARIVSVESASFVLVRLLLRPGTRYDDRREEFVPFDRIVEPDEGMRTDVEAIARAALAAIRQVFVLVNNKAEGCAPATIRALAERLSELGSPPSAGTRPPQS